MGRAEIETEAEAMAKIDVALARLRRAWSAYVTSSEATPIAVLIDDRMVRASARGRLVPLRRDEGDGRADR